MYAEEDCLPLSGIQHIVFCPRQYSLIHVEQQWEENIYTFEGRVMHDRADDPFFFESRGVLLITRSVPLISYKLGLYGVADVVEFHQCQSNGITLQGRSGRWLPYPVEYKRGKPKRDDRDQVQLCAQAMCLEEMLGVAVPEGALFYGKTKRRKVVELDQQLRRRVVELSKMMHELFEQGITPKPVKTKACDSCSLVDICLPKTADRKSVKSYLDNTAFQMGGE
jgi:CRISPR-associated exonuclease Cas4